MSTIDENTVRTILKTKHHCDFGSIRILDWHINENMLEPGVNHLMTRISRLTVRYQLEIGAHKDDISPLEENFIVKVPGNTPLYELAKVSGCYTKEVAMYTQVLPQMSSVIDNEQEFFAPIYYYTDDQQSLVLEDLSKCGFKCPDRIKQVDIEHCIHALQCLAKFHALSVKLETTVGLPECVKHEPLFEPDGVSEVLTALIKFRVPLFIENLPQNVKDRYPSMLAYFENLSSAQVLNDMAKRVTSSSFNVLNHGDFWMNNIMFKYDKYGTIRDVKLIDFQFTTWSSPVRDLIYFTVVNVKFESYVKYFPLLLNIYVDTLNRVLSQLNCPNYHMNSLLEDLDTMYPFALFVLSCVLPMILSDTIDANEPNEDNKTESAMNGAAKTCKQKRLPDILAKWFEHFAQKGTLRIDE